MDYSNREKIADVTRSKYEAVIVASKLARRINNVRFQAQEQLGPDSPIPVYPEKVTTEAINELATGKVKFQIKDVSSAEDQVFLD